MKTIDNRTKQIASRLFQEQNSPVTLRKFWSQINGNAMISSKERDRLKIHSIARFVIGQSRAAKIDTSKVAQILRGLKGKGYICPKNYIEDLRKFLPELHEPLVEIKSSLEIDSKFKRVA